MQVLGSAYTCVGFSVYKCWVQRIQVLGSAYASVGFSIYMYGFSVYMCWVHRIQVFIEFKLTDFIIDS